MSPDPSVAGGSLASPSVFSNPLAPLDELIQLAWDIWAWATHQEGRHYIHNIQHRLERYADTKDELNLRLRPAASRAYGVVPFDNPQFPEWKRLVRTVRETCFELIRTYNPHRVNDFDRVNRASAAIVDLEDARDSVLRLSANQTAHLSHSSSGSAGNATPPEPLPTSLYDLSGNYAGRFDPATAQPLGPPREWQGGMSSLYRSKDGRYILLSWFRKSIDGKEDRHAQDIGPKNALLFCVMNHIEPPADLMPSPTDPKMTGPVVSPEAIPSPLDTTGIQPRPDLEGATQASVTQLESNNSSGSSLYDRLVRAADEFPTIDAVVIYRPDRRRIQAVEIAKEIGCNVDDITDQLPGHLGRSSDLSSRSFMIHKVCWPVDAPSQLVCYGPPEWWIAIYGWELGATRPKRLLETLAESAAKRLLQGLGKGDTLLSGWFIHLAEREPKKQIQDWMPIGPRLLCWRSADNSDSWWAVRLPNVFNLSAVAVEAATAVGNRGVPVCQSGPAGGTSQRGESHSPMPSASGDTPPTLTPTDASVPIGTNLGKRGKNIDARMLKVMADNLESHGWTAAEWADHLRCSPSTVKETKTWTERLKGARALAAADAATKMDKSNTHTTGRQKKKPT